eukprot:m51a1_g9455 hypothetical protein (240) ;mRNA; f:506084-506803
MPAIGLAPSVAPIIRRSSLSLAPVALDSYIVMHGAPADAIMRVDGVVVPSTTGRDYRGLSHVPQGEHAIIVQTAEAEVQCSLRVSIARGAVSVVRWEPTGNALSEDREGHARWARMAIGGELDDAMVSYPRKAAAEIADSTAGLTTTSFGERDVARLRKAFEALSGAPNERAAEAYAAALQANTVSTAEMAAHPQYFAGIAEVVSEQLKRFPDMRRMDGCRRWLESLRVRFCFLLVFRP